MFPASIYQKISTYTFTFLFFCFFMNNLLSNSSYRIKSYFFPLRANAVSFHVPCFKNKSLQRRHLSACDQRHPCWRLSCTRVTLVFSVYLRVFHQRGCRTPGCRRHAVSNSHSTDEQRNQTEGEIFTFSLLIGPHLFSSKRKLKRKFLLLPQLINTCGHSAVLPILNFNFQLCLPAVDVLPCFSPLIFRRLNKNHF